MLTRGAGRAGIPIGRRAVAAALLVLLIGFVPAWSVAEEPAGSVTPHSVRMFFGPDAGTQMLVAWGTESLVPQMIELSPRVAPGGLPVRVVPTRVSAESYAFPDYDPRDGTCEETPTAVTSCYVHPGVGYIHVVRLSGLAPGTTYTYRVGADASGWSAVQELRTAPRTFAGPVTFTAFGDSLPSDVVFRAEEPHYTEMNAAVAAAAGPAFHLQLGDLNYVDSAFTRHVEWWRRWFDEQQPLMTGAPYMWAMGNHERTDPTWEPYLSAIMPQWDQAPFPTWSFRWGDVVVASVWSDSLTAGPLSTPAALDLELSRPEYADAKWKIVTMHSGPYAARWLAQDGDREGHGSNCLTREAFEPVFAEHDVDLVLSGHDHHYQRTYPVKPENGQVRTPQDPDRYPSVLGTTYVIAGSAGKLDPSPDEWRALIAGRACDPDIRFLNQFRAEFAHVRVTETSDGLTVRAVRHDGLLLDEFTMT